MSDPETRDDAVEIIKEGCSLLTVLKKPCPYFGTSKSCLSCSYDWLSIANNVRKVVDRRRASYERERERVKELKIQISELENLMHDAGHGILAFLEIANRAKGSIQEFEDDKDDVEGGEDKKQENTEEGS